MGKVDNNRIYKALVVNDYEHAQYAQWIKEGRKSIETRMNRLFSYRGDVVICCGSTNSVGANAGKALCIVNIFDGMPMKKEHEEAACIEWHPKRKSLLMKDWRYFSEAFEFSKCYIEGAFQGIFTIFIPEHIDIIPQPQIPYYKDNELRLF